MENYLSANLYERQGKAINNFEVTMPKEESDLTKQITKDPYSFNFLTLDKDFTEKELKDALIDNIQRFLLELGAGFAYLGREYRLLVGETEQYIDMLFYNTQVHAYVVIEVKTGPFKPEYTGQLGTYVVAVNHLLKSEADAKTIGILVCTEKMTCWQGTPPSPRPSRLGFHPLSYRSSFRATSKAVFPRLKRLRRNYP